MFVGLAHQLIQMDGWIYTCALQYRYIPPAYYTSEMSISIDLSGHWNLQRLSDVTIAPLLFLPCLFSGLFLELRALKIVQKY